eukprot:CAMPEP_0119332534 /NCGR_PEP_ID=MMETSP1333-20130426/82987_1 /TAXON_ID=418940 /ORGANISM="Scyphosphaera apsteinii, Strain RCC1455" /LENGTH=605 /DNA_ID=CAMNT_0007342391 /DNA_START=333 /DNA_END=2149 /DNA_ORIENTATION=+
MMQPVALATKISADVELGGFDVEFVECKASLTRGQASSVMAVANRFEAGQPLLLVANHIFDGQLLRRLVQSQLDERTDAVTLLDDTDEIVRWAGLDHCKEFCKNGHCNVLVKMLKGEADVQGDMGTVARVAKKMAHYDALGAGAHLISSRFFKTLQQKLCESPLATIADVLSEIADEGRLGFVSTQGLSWYSDLVISTLGSIRTSNSVIRAEWIEGAQKMLSEVQKPTCPLTPPNLPISVPAGSCPSLIELGDTIGEGAFGTVRAASSDQTSSDLDKRHLAVKMVRKDRSAIPGEVVDVCVSDMERMIMWEVHVLQELGPHKHIVRVMDVVDLVDATYIVMQRVDGPELTDFLATQPSGRLCPAAAARFFTQILQALAHAHAKGYLHCDVKPQNVRLSLDCDSAVLTDWGYAQKIGDRATISKGTPAYAPPEQLTGYCSDSVTGCRVLSPAVDVWSLGVTLYQVLCGFMPFDGNHFHDLVRNVLKLNYAIPEGVPHEAAQLIEAMLQISPCDRIAVREMLEHAWVCQSGALLPEVMLQVCEPCDEPQAWWQHQLTRRLVLGAVYAALCLMLLLVQAFGADEILAHLSVGTDFAALDEHAGLAASA